MRIPNSVSSWVEGAGKTYLLTRFAAACRGVYYQATKKTEREQLSTLSRNTEEVDADLPFAVGDLCGRNVGQDGDSGKAVGPDKFAWHLDDEYSQLGRARDAVAFSDPRTRIAHRWARPAESLPWFECADDLERAGGAWPSRAP